MNINRKGQNFIFKRKVKGNGENPFRKIKCFTRNC